MKKSRNHRLSKKEKELLTLVNSAWKLTKSKPLYKKFDVKVPCTEELLELVYENPKLRLAPNVPGGVGISALSIIYTITKILCGRRLLAIIEDGADADVPEGTIIGWTFV